jgi:UDP-glucose 6-dehydrogenase
MNIAVIGSGTCFSEMGNKVTGVPIDADKIDENPTYRIPNIGTVVHNL